MDILKAKDLAQFRLGPRGRSLLPKTRHVIVVDATLRVRNEAIWNGDIDLTSDEPWLTELAGEVGPIEVFGPDGLVGRLDDHELIVESTIGACRVEHDIEEDDDDEGPWVTTVDRWELSPDTLSGQH